MTITEQQIQTAIERAQSNFLNGLNCAESTYEAFIYAGIADMPKETVALATAFGTGGGMTGNQCGILTGCLMALGTVHGRRDPYSIDVAVRKEKLHQINMRAFNILANYFIDHNFGSALCRDLCEQKGGYHNPERKKACVAMVPDMIRKTVEVMSMSEEEIMNTPYGKNLPEYK